MALNAGTRLGSYEVSAQIGKGGMGEVYRATDTNLARQVALKVLPDSLAADVERLARFDREARTLAALNHVNVAAIYGIERASGTTALVMELIEGPTLADRIAAGPLPLDEALPIAAQIAAGLEAAHEQGIIHRDLKPANIKVRPDGTVKVLDFGLAKALEPVGAAATQVAHPPTITTPAMTRAGMILGTAAYMSPEQARGQVVDKRTDVWAFGCVLYEMLTGQFAFGGVDTTDTIAAVIRGEPDWAVLPVATPAVVRRLLRRCLTKDLRQRLPEITTARLDIQDTLAGNSETPTATPSRATRGGARRWAAVAVVGTLALLAAAALRREAPPAELRVDIATPTTNQPSQFALSPDGLDLVFVAPSDERPMLWLRSLEDGSTRALAGTDGAASPFWSPNGRSLGFIVAGVLKRIDLSDGSVRTLFERAGDGNAGGAWSGDGVIVYAPSGVSALSRVDAATPGPTVAVTTLAVQELSHSRPHFLADGRRFLYFVAGTPEVRGLYLGSLDGGTPRRLVTSDGGGVVVKGHLVFPRQGALIAQPFDLERSEVTGDAFRLAERTGGANDSSVVYAVSASATGTLAFRPVAPPPDQLVWFDRSGAETGRVPDSQGASNPELSADGRRLIAGRANAGNSELRALDLVRGNWTRLTVGTVQGAWSPDGRSIAFALNTQGSMDVYRKRAEIAAAPELLLATPALKKVLQWSPDNRFLLYTSQRPDALDNDVLVLPLEGEPIPVALTPPGFNELDARFSPDGKWVAYQSNETGRYEIWAQPFPSTGDRVQISTTGGAQVQWRGDGQELFYVGLDERLMAVPLRWSADGNTLEPGPAMPLFATRIPNGPVQRGGQRQQYVVTPDGQSFLIRTLLEDYPTPPITLILNWNPDRRRAAPTAGGIPATSAE